MGLIFGLVKKLIRLVIYFFIFAAVIVLLPNVPPYTSFTRIDLEPTLPAVGPLTPNSDLNNIEKLYKGKLLGPECFQLHKGEVYTSLATGEIVKLSPGGHVTFVTQIGKPCAGIKEEHKCGRPLGFVISEKGVLYVADAYYGIWSVDLGTNKKTLLVSPQVEINGQIPKLFNSVALDSKGNLYYTDSSADFQLQDGMFAVFADPNGRLIQYNAARNESKVLLDKLWLPNGLVVSPNDEFIILAETGAFRLIKYYINGPKKGQREVFLAGLPGNPDNVRALPSGGGLQAALYTTAGEGEPALQRSLAAAPLARKLLLRLQAVALAALQTLNKQFPHAVLEDAIYSIGNLNTYSGLLPKSSAIVHVDWNGNIIKSYFHTQGETFISDAIFFNDKIYIGQPHARDFVAAVSAPPSFKSAYTSQQKPAVKKEVPNAQAPPKPVPQSKPEAVKTTTPAPVKVETPKTTPPPKPTPQPPKQAPKPTQQPPKPKEQPKPTPAPAKPKEQPASTTPPPAQAPKATPPPAQAATPKPIGSKVNVVTPSPPKPAQKLKGDVPAKPAAKPAEKKPDARKEKTPQQIPITEEIPSDTIKPVKENLKVIKKGGPAEIPNPEL